MKKISMILSLTLLISCVGGLIYFNKEDRYTVKISMIKLKKNYDHTAKWLDSMDNESDVIYDYLNNMKTQLISLKKIEVSRNQLIFEEKLNNGKEIINSINDAIKDKKRDRARYHFKRLRNNCISCHTRYRVGVNF